jgi:tetratricopeptide (TPR) repeat protein
MSAFRTTLLDAARLARELGDRERLVEAALANNRGIFSSAGRVDDERLEVLEAALEAADEGDSVERARLLALVAIESIYAGDYDRRRALSDEAVSIARRLGDPATLAQVLVYRHETIRVPSTLAERAELMAEARALADAAEDPWLQYWTTSFSAHPALESGDLAAVAEFHHRARGIAASLGQPLFAWHVAYHDSWEVLVRGDATASEELATHALARGEEAGEPDAFTIFGTQILCVRWHQGRLGELIELLRTAIADNPGIPAYRAALGRALVEGGDLDAARVALEEATEERFARHHLDNLWLAGVAIWGENAADLGHEAAAQELYQQLEGCSGQVASTGASAFGPVDFALGGLQRLLGDLDRAVSHYERALDLATAMSAPFFTARTQVELARTLRQRAGEGDAPRATTLLEAALALAEEHGCDWVATRARELLA